MFGSRLLPHLSGYIDGEWIDAASGRTTKVVNPSTGEVLAEVPDMGAAEALAAVEAAARAFAVSGAEARAGAATGGAATGGEATGGGGANGEAPGGAATSGDAAVRAGGAHEAASFIRPDRGRPDFETTLEARRAWLLGIAERILAEKDEFGRIITLENGKPLAEGRGEAEYAAGFFSHAASQLDVLRPRVVDGRPRNHDWTVHCRPAGVAALITPWNFPLAMIAKKLSAAIGAGCPVVVKPARKTPLSMIALYRVLEEVGLPRGRANLVTGDSGPIGKVLFEHPAVRVVSFTGSTEVGKQILAATAPHVKRVALELGGNAPFLVFGDADLERAADQLVLNKLRSSGQTCVCANRILVERSALEPFTKALVARVSRLRVGDGMEDGVEVGPLIDGEAFDKVLAHVDDALARGAERMTPVDPRSLRRGSGDSGCYFPPTVLGRVDSSSLCCRDETFGPLFPIVEFGSEDEAVQLANDTVYGLAAYLFTGSSARADRVISRLRFGHVGHNTGTGPVPEAPFGGMKQSGIGREGGSEGILEYVELQTVPRP